MPNKISKLQPTDNPLFRGIGGRIPVVPSLVLIALVAIIFIGVLPATTLQADRTSQKIDKTEWPVVDYAVERAADNGEKTKRGIRGKKYEKSSFRVSPESPSENVTKVDSLDFTLPSLPLAQSNAILMGEVVDAKAYLSNDQTGVYSEFIIRVEEAIKTDGSEPFAVGCLVDVEREGGRVKFPSGGVHWYSVDKERLPRVGRRYVFFLTRQAVEEAFHIVTAYELQNGRVLALDELPQFKLNEGKSEVEFITTLRRLAVSV